MDNHNYPMYYGGTYGETPLRREIQVKKILHVSTCYVALSGNYNTYTYYVCDENENIYRFNSTYTQLEVGAFMQLKLNHAGDAYYGMGVHSIHGSSYYYPDVYEVFECTPEEFMEVLL